MTARTQNIPKRRTALIVPPVRRHLVVDFIPDGAPPLSMPSPTACSFFTDVIPDGARRRAGIQTGTPQMRVPPMRTTREASRCSPKSLDPGFRLRRPRDDIKKQNVIPDGTLICLTSSRTALSLLLPSSRTARPFFLDVIPDGAQRRAGIQTGAPQCARRPCGQHARQAVTAPSRWIPGSACSGPGMTSAVSSPRRLFPPCLFHSKPATPWTPTPWTRWRY